METTLWKLTHLPLADAKLVEIRGRHFHKFYTASLEIVGTITTDAWILRKESTASTMRPPRCILLGREKEGKETLKPITRETNIPSGSHNGGRSKGRERRSV
jgi:hypothetical protein